MADNAIALGVQPVKAPDVIGQISSLAQLQYLAGQAGVANANASILGQKVQSLRDYGSAVAGGADPADALSKSNLAATDPAGANAILGNIGTARGLKASAAYATSLDPNSLAIMGPDAVQKGMTVQANQNFAANGDPNSLRAAGADAYSTAMTALKTGGETAIQRANLMGQIGNGVIAGVGQDGTVPPEIRQGALQQAVKAGLITPQIAQQESKLSDAQFINIAKSWTAAGQASKDYAETSGQAQTNKSAAEANFKPLVTEPQQGVTLPPGLAGVMYPGRAGAAPALPNAPVAGPQSSLPILAQPGSTGAMGLSGVNAGPSSGPNAAPVQPMAASHPQPMAAAPVAPQTSQNGPNYYGVVSQHESGNIPSSINPNGGAAGLYQFMPGTWRTMMQSHPELGLTANGATDPKQAAAAMQAFTADNAKQLSDAGVAVNDKNLFMAHFLGAGGAAKFIQAGSQNPDASAADLFPAAAKQNPTIFYSGSQPRTLGQVYAVMTKSFGNGLTANGAAPSDGAGMAQGTPFAQPGGSVPSNFVQPGIDRLAQTAALGGANPLGGQNPLAAPAPTKLGVAPIVPSSTAPDAAVTPAAGQPPGAPPSIPATGPVTLQPGMTLEEQARQRAVGTGMADVQVKQFGEAKEAAQTANVAQMKLGELQDSLDAMPKNGGLLTPGAGAAERLGMAKYVNTLSQSVGGSPIFDPSAVANAENSQKLTGNLGFDMSRTLGSKEAATITQQAIKLNPGIENTPQGARVVGAAINAGLQRQKDFYQYLSENGNADGADLAFNKANPPSKYIQEAQELATVPTAAVKRLQANPSLSADFDKAYGAGLSRYYTGQ